MRRAGDDRADRKDRRPAVPPPSESLLQRLARDAVAVCGAELLEATLKPGAFLHLVVDGPDGPPGTALLVAVVRELHEALRAEGIDPGDLRIEVDSPGERRALTTPRHFERYRGARVRVLLREPLLGRDALVGSLEAAGAGSITVRTDDGEVHVLPSQGVHEIRLHPRG